MKEEVRPHSPSKPTQNGLVEDATATPPAVISLDSSSTRSDSDEPSSNGGVSKRRKLENLGVVLPVGFPSPLPQPRTQTTTAATPAPTDAAAPENSSTAGIGPFFPFFISSSMDVKTEVKQGDRPLSPSDPTQNGLVAGATATPPAVISLESCSSGSDSHEPSSNAGVSKRRKLDNLGAVLPVYFLSPLPQPRTQTAPAPAPAPTDAAAPENSSAAGMGPQLLRQFWKAGKFDGAPPGNPVWDRGSVIPMDHVRLHPNFLHSNATSHKWAFGAFAELLDNALDEYPNGATYVNIDMVRSRKDGSKMLLIEDDGGGMDLERMRQCMSSFGLPPVSKEIFAARTIGQYGKFKSSTMGLGADVIVFSRSIGKDGKSPTQSIGLLSYTFLRATRKKDIIVPMVDYEYVGEQQEWNRISNDDFNRNFETITQWSPFASETDLFGQFNMMSNHGTRVIIYNLWEDDQGLLELDFDSDPHDIQLRGVNREEKHIEMAKQYPNSKHFLTYRHSLRSYAAILYLRLPAGFRIILRGLDVEHHNIVDDMMLSEKLRYRPQGADGVAKDDMAVAVTVGFVKDAEHIDLRGFNVYHKNRLIKPFWRLWNSESSEGRGVIGVLEANFVEPAPDKQGFESTTVLSRLETGLVKMQTYYWSKNCEHIGYDQAGNKKHPDEVVRTNFGDLPRDIQETIFKKLPWKYLGRTVIVSHEWQCIRDTVIASFPPALRYSVAMFSPKEHGSHEQLANVLLAKLLKEPLVPHLAVANLFGRRGTAQIVNVGEHLRQRLGTRTVIVVFLTRGVMGKDVTTNRYEELGAPQAGLALTIAFLPGVRIDAMPINTDMDSCLKTIIERDPGLQKFVERIRAFSDAPSAMMLFGWNGLDDHIDIRALLCHHFPNTPTVGTAGLQRGCLSYPPGPWIHHEPIGYHGTFPRVVCLVFAPQENYLGPYNVDFRAFSAGAVDGNSEDLEDPSRESVENLVPVFRNMPHSGNAFGVYMFSDPLSLPRGGVTMRGAFPILEAFPDLHLGGAIDTRIVARGPSIEQGANHVVVYLILSYTS
ncbi:hypothetical protein Tsubulata_038974 [Turnera subulata]|uniref:Morc S5 domain-containing protein n=1 Tax=Turnera subulata TaxID=218843 RepID=A0A9Q0J0Q9_9ROSI|nr:hypothetical protein Tsubulata_038974 [Turnera subulata]